MYKYDVIQEDVNDEDHKRILEAYEGSFHEKQVNEMVDFVNMINKHYRINLGIFMKTKYIMYYNGDLVETSRKPTINIDIEMYESDDDGMCNISYFRLYNIPLEVLNSPTERLVEKQEFAKGPMTAPWDSMFYINDYLIHQSVSNTRRKYVIEKDIILYKRYKTLKNIKK